MHGNHSQVAVVVVPLPAQGHLNQLLHLSRLISAYNLPVFFFGTATHNRQAKTRVHGFDPLAHPNLHFHDFPTPHFPNLPPDSNSSNIFPSHLSSMILTTLANLQEPFHNLLSKLSTKFRRVVVIFDSLTASSISKAVKSVPNAESYCFETVSAFSLYSFYWELAGRPVVPQGMTEILKELPSLEGCFSPEIQELLLSQAMEEKFSCGTIYNSNRVIEGMYLDLLAKTGYFGPDKQFAIGPFNPVTIPMTKQGSITRRPECLDWLDRREQNSVIFVSFGTSTVYSNEQVKEIATGLESSGQKFVWILKDADKGDIFTGEVRNPELPKGFEERVKERGIIVRDWAPQLEILGHFATGGFMTHCGWNSCMESISMGVPIATWAMHSDQPSNAVFLTKGLKIGLQVRDWAQRNGLVSSVKVGEDVKKLMASIEGDEMRQRAKKLAEDVNNSTMKGGATRLEMDSFIAHISRHISISKL